MCKKIKEIHNLKPSEILEKYWQNDAPIDMKLLLCQMGIDSTEVNFSPLERALYVEGNDKIRGLAYSEKDELGIFYASGSDPDVNYVLAHELGHCCLHLPVSAEFHVEMKTDVDIYGPPLRHGLWKRRWAAPKIEEAADRFAANLLIPTDELFSLLSQNKHWTITELAQKFNVPDELLRKKLSLL